MLKIKINNGDGSFLEKGGNYDKYKRKFFKFTR